MAEKLPANTDSAHLPGNPGNELSEEALDHVAAGAADACRPALKLIDWSGPGDELSCRKAGGTQ